MRILTVALVFLIPVSLYASAQPHSGGLAERVAELEAQVGALTAALQEAQEILQFVRVETEEMDGLAGPHWIIEGANVHVRSGSSTTDDNCLVGDPGWPNCEILTGLGNLIVGYNGRLRFRSLVPEVRTGSYNLVVGDFHSYSSFGGFVAGEFNAITGAQASVSGGHRNLASGEVASASGGRGREAPDEVNWAAGNLFESN